MKIEIVALLPRGAIVRREIEGEQVGEQVALTQAPMVGEEDIYLAVNQWAVTHIKSGWRIGGVFLDKDAARNWAEMLGAVDLDAYWEAFQAGQVDDTVKAQVEALRAELLTRWGEGSYVDV